MRKYGLNITKERILTLSIISIGYLLISANQVFMNPPVTQSGLLTYEYTTPINQTANHTVIKESLTSTNWVLIQNFTHYKNYNYFQIPFHDYDLVVFNLTLEPISGEKEVQFRIFLGGGDPEIFQTISNRTTLTLETDLANVKSERAGYWVLDVVPSVSPIEEFTIHCLEVWAYSSIPLCPVTVDIRSTDNASLFDNILLEKLAYFRPVLVLSLENTSYTIGKLYPHTANYSYYLRPTRLVGYVEWSSIAGRSDIEVDIEENETIYWIINLESVRIDLSIDVDYPLYRINCFTGDTVIYDMYLTPSQMPASFYIPSIYMDFRISLVKLLDNRYSSLMDNLFLAESILDVNGTANIHIDVAFNHLFVLGHYTILHIIISVLVMSLFLIVLARLFLYLRSKWPESKKRIVIDFRLFPIVLFCILALVPWFFSTRVFHPFWTDDAVLIHSVSLGPLPIMGIWTEGSPIFLAIPSQAIEWFFWSIILYWLPLLWCLLFLTTPSYRGNDLLMGLILFGPAIFGLFWSTLLPNITDSPTMFSFANFLALSIPISWLIGISLIRKYYVFGLNFDKLKRDEQSSKEFEKSPKVSDKSYTHDIFFSLQFYLFVILTLFTPCLVGFYSNIYSTERIFVVNPVQVIYYIIPDYGYLTYQKLGALLVGIPYAIFTIFALIWVWQWMNEQKSIIWIFVGTAISILSMSPGFAILSLYSGWGWTITWVPIPIVIVLMLLFSFAVLLREEADS